VTLIDTSSSLRVAEQAPDVGIEPDAAAVSVTDTTELRWFVEGHLPPDVMSWFTRKGTVGLAEERCDTYRLDGRFDTGVKRRFREKLELKVRRSIGDRVVLGNGLAGRLEVWRRWSPAECLGESGENATWADVYKMVIKRRFAVDGSEVPITEELRAATGTGCDVEIASVSLDDTEAWTFAFAAYGPLASRREVLIASWRALRADGSPPDQFGPFFGRSSGYPEWLADVTSRGAELSMCEVRQP
jgi:hypothetical protein